MRRHLILCFSIIALAMTVACGEKKSEGELREQALTLEKQEKYEEAFEVYERLLAAYPESEYASEALHKMAFMHYNNSQDFQQAIDYHRRLIERFPDSEHVPKARFMIGYIYANDMKDYASAGAAYEEFLAHHPDHELAASVKWELKHLGEDVDKQLQTLFSDAKTNGGATSK